MTRPRHCISSSCELPLFARVTYCPFCGSRQQREIPTAPADSTPEPEAPRETVTGSTPELPTLTDQVEIAAPASLSTMESSATTSTSQKSKTWWVVGTAFFAAIAVAVAFHFHTSSVAAQCVTPSRNVLVVLDFSGQPSLTIGEIVDRIQALFDKTRDGERFALFDTRADRPIFEACSSPLALPTRAEVRDQLTETILHAITMNAAPRLESLPNLTESPRQKISQKITDLSLTAYMRANENSLHLVSDLLEGNPAFFETLCEPAARATENFRLARRGGMEQAEFLNTHVYLHLVPRQDIAARSLNCRDKYWRWLLANTSGTGAGVSIEYLPSSTRSSNE